jgi:hypothetical protein
MKKILLIISVLFSNYVFAQDSLNYVLKGNKFINKIKPIVGFGFKNQSILESNGYGPYLNFGITYNNSFKLTYGLEYVLINKINFYSNNSLRHYVDAYNFTQKNLGLSYIYKDYQVLHTAFNLKFNNTTVYSLENGFGIAKFRGIKPGIDLQLNINKVFRFSIGFARNISYARPDILNAYQLNGNEFSFGFEFSRFKK